MGQAGDEKNDKKSRHAHFSDEDISYKQPDHRRRATSIPRPASRGVEDSAEGVPTGKQSASTSRPGQPPAINTNINPALGQNQVWLHNQSARIQAPLYSSNYPGVQLHGNLAAPQYLVTAPAQPGIFQQQAAVPIFDQPVPLTTAASGQAKTEGMGDYQNTAPINPGASFQPQVPSTQNGPELHYYYPRHDMAQYYQPAFQPAPGVAAVPLQQTGYVANVTAPMPAIVAQQPLPGLMMMPGQQAVPIGGPPVIGAPPMMMSGAAPFPGAAGIFPPAAGASFHPDPVTGIGQTGQELRAAQAHFAYANNMFEPQDFKPADDDPSRYYFVREVDGEWTQRNRFTIDNLGDCRWYITDAGVFYAVRMPN